MSNLFIDTLKELPTGARITADQFAKNTVKGLNIWKQTAQGMAKMPIRVASSLFVDVPRTWTGHEPLKPFNVPLLGETKTYARDAVDNAETMGAFPAALMAGSTAVLDVATLGKAAETGVKYFSDARMKQLQTVPQIPKQPVFKTDLEAARAHIGSAKMVEKYNPDVPKPELIERAKVNIVNGLEADGFKNGSRAVKYLDPKNYKTVEEFGDAVDDVIQNSNPEKILPGQTIYRGEDMSNAGGNFFSRSKEIARRYNSNVTTDKVPLNTLDARKGLSDADALSVKNFIDDELAKGNIGIKDGEQYKPLFDKGYRAVIVPDHMTGEANIILNPNRIRDTVKFGDLPSVKAIGNSVDDAVSKTKDTQTLYHLSDNTFKNGKPDFDAYFGDKEWIDTYGKEFGKNMTKVNLPKGSNIIDITDDTPIARKILSEKFSPKQIDDFFNDGDPAIGDKIRELWVQKKDMLPILKKNGIDGAMFTDGESKEFLLQKSLIDKLNVASDAVSEGKISIPTLLKGGALGTGIASMFIPQEKKTEPLQDVLDNKEIMAMMVDKPKMREAIKSVETQTKSKPYSYRREIDHKYGDALGAYQVREATLKEWGEKFIGKKVTDLEFMTSQKLQDKYMDGFIQFMIDEGVTDPKEIMALHNQGITGWGDPEIRKRKVDKSNKDASNYADDALSHYLK